MDMNYEEKRAEFEAERNKAMDRYFGTRPQLMRTGEQERLFEAGFRMAYESAAKQDLAHTKTIEERDHWHDKATELAKDVGKMLGFDVGEHCNANCPVQTAIDGVFEMTATVEAALAANARSTPEAACNLGESSHENAPERRQNAASSRNDER